MFRKNVKKTDNDNNNKIKIEKKKKKKPEDYCLGRTIQGK